MNVVIPITVTDAQLEASNVLLNDADEWDSATTYAADAVVMVTTTANGASEATLKLYKSTAGTNNEDPTLRTTYTSGDDEVLWWKEVSSVNRYKMFDQVIQDQTERADEIDVTIEPGERADAVALFNVEASEVQVIVTADPEGVVYDETVNLVIEDDIDNWWSYFNTDPEFESKAVFFDLSAFTGASVRVRIKNDGSTARCGALVIGSRFEVGTSVYEPTFGITDLSQVDTDEDGRTTIEGGGFLDVATVPVRIETRRFGIIKRKLTALRSMPTVWVTEQSINESLIYGIYEELELVISSPSVSECALDIRGLL